MFSRLHHNKRPEAARTTHFQVQSRQRQLGRVGTANRSVSPLAGPGGSKAAHGGSSTMNQSLSHPSFLVTSEVNKFQLHWLVQGTSSIKCQAERATQSSLGLGPHMLHLCCQVSFISITANAGADSAEVSGCFLGTSEHIWNSVSHCSANGAFAAWCVSWSQSLYGCELGCVTALFIKCQPGYGNLPPLSNRI